MHECDECGKKFTTKKSMETHKVVHTGEKSTLIVANIQAYDLGAWIKNVLKMLKKEERSLWNVLKYSKPFPL